MGYSNRTVLYPDPDKSSSDDLSCYGNRTVPYPATTD